MPLFVFNNIGQAFKLVFYKLRSF